MKAAMDHQFLWLQMMRGGSKTYILARFILNYALTVPGTPIVITAPTFRQALLLFDYMLEIIELNAKNENALVKVKEECAGEPKRNILESILRFKNGSSIRALPMGDGRKIRGIRGGVLIVDEFYQITEEMYEQHIKPFVSVIQGGRESKIIHSTTSWYQDCYAHERLMQIASEVKSGIRPMVL
jgi:phage terminase large subunit-like protein